MVGASLVEEALDLVGLGLGPLAVHRASVLDQAAPDGEQAEGDDGLLVDDIVLVANGVDAQGGGGGEDGGLGEDRVAGEGIDDGLGLLLGVLGGNVRGVAGPGDGGRDGGKGAAGKGWPEEVRACCVEKGELSVSLGSTGPCFPACGLFFAIVGTAN